VIRLAAAGQSDGQETEIKWEERRKFHGIKNSEKPEPIFERKGIAMFTSDVFAYSSLNDKKILG
jgi:hypothetical protein